MIKKSFLILTLLIYIFFISSTKTSQTGNNPIIYSISPDRAFFGDQITIVGEGFGDKRNSNKVLFGDVSCSDYDFDYIYWSNNCIRVKVPTGAGNNYIKLIINDEVITGPYFISEAISSREYTNPQKLTIDYTIDVLSSENINIPFYLWMPSPVPCDKQQDVKLLDATKNHIETQNDYLDLFKLNNIIYGKDNIIKKRFSFMNYEVKTKINPDNVPLDYDKNTDFYKYYTSSEYGIESNNPSIIKTAEMIVKDEKNPYIKAKLIYNWVVNHMDYQYPPPNRSWRAITGLSTGRGDCAVYSFLFSALCRATGIPARALAGHVIFMNDYISMHFWAEFYLPKYGWIPIDANYGDVQVEGFKPKDFYFGNMDNRHIAFSKGRVLLNIPDFENNGKVIAFSLPYLQKYHAYLNCKNSDKLYYVKRSLVRVADK